MRAATVLLLLGTVWSVSASAATWGELGRGPGPAVAPAPGPYAGQSVGSCPPCGPVGAAPSGAYEGAGLPSTALDAPASASLPPAWSMPPEALLPSTPRGLPSGALLMGTFGQINTTTDPYNPWGLSTPFMFVPWSTPLSGWTNAQTWNWWRTRSGVRSPAW